MSSRRPHKCAPRKPAPPATRTGALPSLGRQPQQGADALGGDEGLARLAHDQPQHIERQADLDHVGIDQDQVADRHPAVRDMLPRQQHDGTQPHGDDPRLPDMQLRQGILVAHRCICPLAQHAFQPGCFAGFRAIELDRLVVQQTVDHLAARQGIQVVQLPLQRNAPADLRRGIGAIRYERHGHDAGERRIIADHQDADDRGDFHDRRQECEERGAHEEGNARRTPVQVAGHAAGLSRAMESRPQGLQMAKDPQGERHDGLLCDRGKHDVPDLRAQAAGKAQQYIAQHQENRQCRAGRGAQYIDDPLQCNRHDHHEQFGCHQQQQCKRRPPAPIP